MTAVTMIDTPLGRCLLAGDETALTGLWLEGAKHFARTLDPQAQEGDLPVLRDARQWLRAYFAGERPSPRELPLAPKGSAFEQTVWALLLEIPYGETTTYGALSRLLCARQQRDRMSAQAIGGAVGRNPISIIIPCHRVLGANGSLTGYAGGMEKKAALLRLEQTFPQIDR